MELWVRTTWVVKLLMLRKIGLSVTPRTGGSRLRQNTEPHLQWQWQPGQLTVWASLLTEGMEKRGQVRSVFWVSGWVSIVCGEGQSSVR